MTSSPFSLSKNWDTTLLLFFSTAGLSIIEEAVSATGYFSTTNKSINSQISRYNTKIDRANLQVETYKSNLEAKFQAMEDTISKMQNSYNSFLSSN